MLKIVLNNKSKSLSSSLKAEEIVDSVIRYTKNPSTYRSDSAALDDIIADVKRDAPNLCVNNGRQKELGDTEKSSSSDYIQNKPLPAGLANNLISLKPLRFQKIEMRLPDNTSYELERFLDYYDKDFVVLAYQALLKRLPDEQGELHYLEGMRSKLLTRVEVLGALRYSGEGRNYKVKIRGLFKAFVLQRLYRLPIIGYFVQMATAMINLPKIVLSLSNIENQVMSNNKQVQQELEAYSMDIAKVTASHQSCIHSIADSVELQAKQTNASFEVLKSEINQLEESKDSFVSPY